MVIGFDGSKAFRKDRTGVENYSYQLLVHLAKIDHENNYIVYLDPRVNKRPTEKWPDNFKFKSLHYPFMWTQLGLALQTYLDRLDLLFETAHTLPLLKNPKLKSLITVHDLGAEYLGHMHQVKQRLYLALMTKLQLKFADRIIAVSNATKKDLVERIGLPTKKIEVVYEGFNEELLSQTDPKGNIFKQFDIQKGNYFLFVGTIQPRKNLHRLIEAYVEIYGTAQKPPELVLAGGKGWLADPIYQHVYTFGLQDKIKFTGRVDDQTLVALYKNALCFVFPSLFEGFGLPILEAFSFGCPVITSNTSSTPEVAGDAALLVDPYDVSAIASAMKRLAKDPKLRTDLAKKGKVQVKKFSWENAAKETLKIVESMK
jgi:glycosyltransferase involved in cell wall biosynthesis